MAQAGQYSPAVNLGAGGFPQAGLVSYFDNGGATPGIYATPPEGSPRFAGDPGIYATPLEGSPRQEPKYTERGLGSFIIDQLRSTPREGEEALFNMSMPDKIRKSGRSDSTTKDMFYPEGPTFFEQLAEKYNYPVEELPEGGSGIHLYGKTRHSRPREDMPTAQELEDARAHMLGSAITAGQYGPETAKKIGNINEYIPPGNREHRRMDLRNNAVGINLFKKAGINISYAEFTEKVDARIFEQLAIILGRNVEERSAPSNKPGWNRNFESPEKGPDLYFPRDNSGYFIPGT